MDDTLDKSVKNFRIFFWGIPSPAGKTYDRSVAELIVRTINEQGLMASFSPKLNLFMVSGYTNKAEIKGNVVYADIGLIADHQADIPNWGDGEYRATVVLKTTDTTKSTFSAEDITSISHVLIYS